MASPTCKFLFCRDIADDIQIIKVNPMNFCPDKAEEYVADEIQVLKKLAIKSTEGRRVEGRV